ncbi:TIGR04222 domain-containing membrane protein [Methylobacterium sp. WSM2598]|uniref:TIGR04222 domain-containing membrane protein n=1 Tax=Methylobacterium sp. WSM2598 TaxID=398261 RepID=UPI0003745AED|nr:TIGR04222 domain-containing membrane protein [Methylobacterium sp. WSM2598]
MQPVTPAIWSPAEAALWDRIAAHPFEVPGRDLDFTRRLARDRGWSLAFARGAVAEYRRFCFLACLGAGPVTPSEEVDEVWHLHLTDSRDYWDVWCRDVLRTPLHHEPAAGGPAERARLVRQYAETLARYEARFGPPGPLFWPGTRARFRRTPRYRTVDTDRTIVLARPRLLRGPLRAAAALAALLAGLGAPPAAALPADPLDWPGPPFLQLYAGLAAAALLIALALRAACRGGEAPAMPKLSLPDLAYLAGGPQRVADVVALALYERGGASVDPASRRILVWPHRPPLPSELEPFRPPAGDRSRAELRAALDAPVERLSHALAARGLVPPRERVRLLRGIGLAVLGAVLALGLANLGVGLSRDRPVGFLALMMGATALLGLWTLLHPMTRTRAGDRVLEVYRSHHARAARAPLPNEVLFAFAVSGALALVGTELTGFVAFLRPPGGSDGGGGGDGGGDGGGGGGGCGGCGGGGGD